MNGHLESRAGGRVIAGALLILLGVLFTLDSFGIVRAGELFDYWPLILVGVGLAKILAARRPEQRVGGVVLLALGALFFLRTLHFVWFQGRDLWPLLFLVVGGALLWQGLRRRGAPPGGAESPEDRSPEGGRSGLDGSASWRGARGELGSVLHEFAFMGGGDRVVRSPEFRGGDVTAILGGFKIDLRGAGIAGDSATIEVFAFWGGVEMRVPEDWNVAVHGTPILGAFVNRSRPGIGEATGKTLVVRGSVIMGGVEVKN